MGVEQAGVDGDAGGRHGESFVVKEDGNGRGEDFLRGCELAGLEVDADV